MENRNVPNLLMVAGALLAGAPAWAQSTNGTTTLLQDAVSSAGGRIGDGNPMRAQTILGLPASGRSTNGVFSLTGGLGTVQPATRPITATVTVTGTTNDPAATVRVNGVPAAVSAGTFTAQGVLLILGPNTITVTATDSVGNQATRSITVCLDLPQSLKQPRFHISITGTISDASAAVSVNGIAASIAQGQFTASVPVTNGLNTVTAVATDPAGNQASSAVTVFVRPPATPPAMPTVGTVGDPIPSVTTSDQLTLGGTKTPGTAIWVNGQKVYAADEGTIWTATLTLIEGDNRFAIVTKDTLGTASAEVVVTVVLDRLPPVVNFTPPAKTNFNPAPLAGQVDDHLTTVTINGIPAVRNGRDFTVNVPLTLGSNVLQFEAVSPNGYRTTQTVTIVLGRVPAVTTVSPPDRAFVYVGQPLAIQITAVDPEGDPIIYRVQLDGALLRDWAASPTVTWTPQAADFGTHTLTVNVRDDFGGVGTATAGVFAVRRPVEHP